MAKPGNGALGGPEGELVTHFQTPEAPAEWTAIVTSFIARHLAASGRKGVVLGLSGGLDSAVVADLAVRALGKDAVVPFVMPAPGSDPADRDDALLVAKHLGLAPVERPIAAMVEAFSSVVGKTSAAVQGNAKSRSRMMVLYAEAQSRDMLVCGTGNKSELLTGYFTKHGDGGVDLQPIGDLYKTQVFELARWLGLPKRVVDKAPSAGLHPGQTDESDMGISYGELDRILKGMELNQDLETIARRTGLPLAQVEKVDAMVRRTEHKRRLALIPKIGVRTVGLDWRRPVQLG